MDSRNNKSLPVVATAAFAAGICVATILRILDERRKKNLNRRDAGASAEGMDSSLYYGDPAVLRQTTEKQKFLPKEIYGQMVRDCVICCVDVLLVRVNPKTKVEECLLVERGAEPVKGVWWYPGGRMFKGETFFDTALRKVRDETGITSFEAKAVQILGTWNTFFPVSAWDTEKEKGTHTVNPLVLVILPEGGSAQDVKLDKTSENFKWIPVDADLAEKNGEDKYVLQGMRRYAAWNATFGKGN